jgi:hypothetical protein
MPDTLVYVLSNETTGIDGGHDSSSALDAINRAWNTATGRSRNRRAANPRVLRLIWRGRGPGRDYHEVTTRWTARSSTSETTTE